LQSSLPASRADLLAWFDHQQRDLPWRHTRDPYAIWVSEVMLQQTRVETVRRYWDRWLETFPTVAALAAASTEAVLSQWQGLGYYRRARNLQAGAIFIVEQLGGLIPTTAAAWQTVPGVGPYTAGAIASIAFGEPAPAVDGNVLRVLSRWLALELPIDAKSGRAAIDSLAAELASGPRPGTWTQALMELGATLCTPTSPACLICPVSHGCAAAAMGDPTRFPLKAKAKAPREEHRVALALWQRDTGAEWWVQRQDQGLLGGLWEFPLLSSLEEAEEVAAPLIHHGDILHIFTHIRLSVTLCSATQDPAEPPIPVGYQAGRWVLPEERESLPQSRLMRKLRERLPLPRG
jgi:A/G-specific adenine glycosylase